ncbi:MAG: hypothetical protein NW201_07385, partial [Gemmatimonadales bacterium]|nr:hypothetical protein [Gemmatimonadales bacterium]
GAPAAPAPRAVPGPGPSRAELFGVWFRVALIVALAGAMPFWPFVKRCGGDLALFLGALAALGLGAVGAAVASWRTRRAGAHLLALLVLAWTLALAAAEVLPRAVWPQPNLTWSCE